MRVAALDLGSNSFLLTIAEATSGGYVVLHDESIVCRLGQGVNETQAIQPEALIRVERCFKHYSEVIKKFNVSHIKAVSTSAARDAKNKSDFLSLGEKYGIPIEIISGANEAELTFSGGTFDFDSTDEIAVVDVGGGSTEIIGLDSEQDIKGYSLNIGAVRLTEMFVSKHPISKVELGELKQYVESQFKDHGSFLPERVKKMIAVAGTPTTLACVIKNQTYDDSIHQSEISLIDLQKWVEKLSAMDVEQRSQLVGMQPGRADVIVAGILILIATLEYYNLKSLFVSTKGVRFALIKEMLKKIK